MPDTQEAFTPLPGDMDLTHAQVGAERYARLCDVARALGAVGQLLVFVVDVRGDVAPDAIGPDERVLLGYAIPADAEDFREVLADLTAEEPTE